MFNVKIVGFTFFLFLAGCQQSADESQPSQAEVITTPEKPMTQQEKQYDIQGLWRGVLQSPGGELPFGIEITGKGNDLKASIINGREKADTSSITVNGQEVEIQFDWYDAQVTAKLDDSGNSMQGEWRKTVSGGKSSVLPFIAQKGYSYRFSLKSRAPAGRFDITGPWHVVFTDEDGKTEAFGEFEQKGQIVSGTFLTATGDYRFLEGSFDANQLRLSTFDGSHAFLFTAEWTDNKLVSGHFWSRDSYHATWTAEPTSKTVKEILPDSWNMIKTSQDVQVNFAFEDINGKLVSLQDAEFKNKPVLINLFGTWCPNCNDEAPVLVDFYNTYHDQGLEIIGLAFEYTGDKSRDKKQITAFKERYGIQYPLLLAGVNDKEEAAKTLGFLDEVVAYPTSIFLDHNHNILDVHSGFSGPGTGDHYKKLVEQLENKIKQMIAGYQQANDTE